MIILGFKYKKEALQNINKKGIVIKKTKAILCIVALYGFLISIILSFRFRPNFLSDICDCHLADHISKAYSLFSVVKITPLLRAFHFNDLITYLYYYFEFLLVVILKKLNTSEISWYLLFLITSFSKIVQAHILQKWLFAS